MSYLLKSLRSKEFFKIYKDFFFCKVYRELWTSDVGTKDKLAREQILKYQKVDFQELYNDCLSSPNFEVKTEKDQYQINFDLLMINKDGYKILVPDNLIGPLLAYTHLLGHMGT